MTARNGIRVLGVAHHSTGYGFVVLEGPAAPVEWSGRRLGRQKRRESLVTARSLLSWYRPDVLAVEDCRGAGCRRGSAVRVRIEDLVALATRLDIRVVRYSRNLVQKCFAPFGATTRFEIALVIARELPELASRRPRKRKLWMSEDARMPLFDAAALALTFFYCQSRSGTR